MAVAASTQARFGSRSARPLHVTCVHGFGRARARGKLNLFCECKGRQSADAAETTVYRTVFRTAPNVDEPVDRLCGRQAGAVVHYHDLRLKPVDHYVHGSATLRRDRVGRVLKVFPIEDQWVVIHSGCHQAQQVSTDDWIGGHQVPPGADGLRGDEVHGRPFVQGLVEAQRPRQTRRIQGASGQV